MCSVRLCVTVYTVAAPPPPPPTIQYFEASQYTVHSQQLLPHTSSLTHTTFVQTHLPFITTFKTRPLLCLPLFVHPQTHPQFPTIFWPFPAIPHTPLSLFLKSRLPPFIYCPFTSHSHSIVPFQPLPTLSNSTILPPAPTNSLLYTIFHHSFNSTLPHPSHHSLPFIFLPHYMLTPMISIFKTLPLASPIAHSSPLHTTTC